MATKKAKRKEEKATKEDVNVENDNDKVDDSGTGKVLLGLVGALVVLFILCGGVWGVAKVIDNVRNREDDSSTSSEQEQKDDQDSIDQDSEGSESDGEEGDDDGEQAQNEEDTTDEDEIAEDIVEEDSNGEEGDINGDGATTDDDTEQDISEDEGLEEAVEDTMNKVWTAIDYKKGDIEGDAYTVVWGDTLWEIAEGRYGSGYEWTKIRDANADIVQPLPSGSWALIVPGQVLTLPSV